MNAVEPLILGIESSCDETGVGIVRGTQLLTNTVSSSMDEHVRFGGVIPEIASRAHLEAFVPTLRTALDDAGVTLDELDAIAVTAGPGLSGALMVGVSAAKALAVATGKPLYAVNHLVAHVGVGMVGGIFADGLPPNLGALLVSGGHTEILRVGNIASDVELLGSTIDDAAGEAYDKTARILGLGYPGGPAIDRVAMEGDPTAIRFPRAMRNEGLDFSFSGLKTAVVNHVRKHPEAVTADVAASFQEAVVDVLVAKARRAAQQIGAKGLVLGGGVAANSLLRERFLSACVEDGFHGLLPSRAMCTDNAAMVAAAGWWRLRSDGPSPLDTGAHPNLGLPLLGN